LRERVIGGWTHGGTAELTFLREGNYQAATTTAEGTTRNDGKWKVKHGALITEAAHVSYAPQGTNAFRIRAGFEPLHHRIVLIDCKHMAVAIDASEYHRARTNVWERKQ